MTRNAAGLAAGPLWPGLCGDVRAAVSPDGRVLALFRPEGHLALVDLVTGATGREYAGHFGDGPLAFSPDG